MPLDFTTSDSDRPLVVQFAASTPVDFARAAEMVMPYSDGVNLNCGCPQSWAIQEGVGCAMMRKPDDVAAMVRAVKERCGAGFCVSVKIRVHKDIEYGSHHFVLSGATGYGTSNGNS